MKSLILSICAPLAVALFLLYFSCEISDELPRHEKLLLRHLIPCVYLAMNIPALVYTKYIEQVTGERNTTPETIMFCAFVAGIASAIIYALAFAAFMIYALLT